jgi:hypothetical protein
LTTGFESLPGTVQSREDISGHTDLEVCPEKVSEDSFPDTLGSEIDYDIRYEYRILC